MVALSPAERRRREKRAVAAKKVRDERRRLKICIDQPKSGPPHGRVHKGGRCFACWEKKKGSS